MTSLQACLIAVCATLAANESSVPGPMVDVRNVLGVPTFVVDNEPFAIPCFETYVPEERYFTQFAGAGVKLFSFNTNAAACDYGHSKDTWIAPEQWDYSCFDERMRRVLAANPDALVIPRINLGTPRWWLDAHPEEMEVLHHGSTRYREPNRNPTHPKDRALPSIASEKWRSDMGMALERFLDHVQNSEYGDHIFGYFLAGLDTEEWYHWSSGSNCLSGYSIPTQQAFREWLRRRYGSDETIKKAWNRPDITLDSVSIPTYEERFDGEDGTFRDPSRKRNVIDFYLFHNEIIPETIDYFARIAKEKTRDTKVIGAFYGYMYEFRGDPEYGHNALWRYNQSSNLDFIFVTASYEERQFATGGDYSRSPAHSVRLHGKLWYHDNDVVSYRAPEVLKSRGMTDGDDWSTNLSHHLRVLGYTETPEQTSWMYRRSMGFSICNGAYESYFDLHGGYYDAPDLMEEVKCLNRVSEVAVRYPRASNSEILVVADEASCSYMTFRNPMLANTLLKTQHQLIKLGAPVDHVLLSDLPLLETSPYKLVIMLNGYYLSGMDREMVREKLLNNGRHVLWCYAPGYITDSGLSEQAMENLTGIRIQAGGLHEKAAPRIVSQGSQYSEIPAIGVDYPIAQPFFAVDDRATTLGIHPDSKKPTMARRDMGNWVSIYAVTANLPPSLYREIAREAGVHIYNERDDTLYANQTFLTLHANGEGERTITFPWACDITDMITDQPLAVNTDKLTYLFKNGETLILRWKTRL